MQVINVQGVGNVSFPDDMSREDIAATIQRNTLPAAQRKTTRSLFDPQVQEATKPAFEALETSARNGGVFGSPPAGSVMDVGNLMDAVVPAPEGAESPVLKSKRAYEGYRDTFAKDFNLKPEEADDIIRHRLDLQPDPVSRDALGGIHIKNEVLAQDNESIKNAINASKLPDDIKTKVIGETDERVARFKEGFLNSIRQNHKELAGQLNFTGNLNEDFKKVLDNTNETAGQQFMGGLATGVIDFLDTAGNLNPLRSEDEEQLAQNLREASSATKSINDIGYELKEGKLNLFGTDAAAYGQGAASVGGSLALGTMTGGAGNLLFPPSRVAALGPVGQTLAGAASRVANVAPTAGFFAAQQGGQTYDQAIEAGKSEQEAKDLALKSAAIEFFGTTVFSGVGLGGVEDLTSGNIRTAVKQATKTTAGKEFLAGLGGVGAEVLEESFITAADTVAVQAKLHPELSVDDLVQSLKDTAKVTIASAGVAETAARGTGALKSTADKTTEELETIADESAKETVLEDQTSRRKDAQGSIETVVGGGEVDESTPQTSDTAQTQAATQQPSSESSGDSGILSDLQGNAEEVSIPNSQGTVEAVNGDGTSAQPDAENNQGQISVSSEGTSETGRTQTTSVDESAQDQRQNTEAIPSSQTGLSVSDVPLQESVSVVEGQTGRDSVSDQLASGEMDAGNLTQSPDQTSLRFASIDKDLESLNLPSVATQFTGKDADNWAKAKERTEEGPRIVNRLNENPGALESTTDKMILLQETARRKQAVAKALEDVNNGIEGAETDLAYAERDFDQAVQAVKASGSLQGALLRAQRFATTKDYNLVSMRNEVRAKINNGSDLTAAQAKEIETLSKKISEAEEEVAVQQAELTELRKAAQEADEILRLSKKPSNKKSEIKRRIEAAKKRMAERALDPDKSFSGADPALVRDTVALIYDYIQLGVVSLDEIRTRMVEKFGEKIAPYVDAHYDESRALYDELNPVVAEGAEPTPANIRKAAERVIQQGVKGTTVLDEVAKQFGMDRNAVRDIFLDPSVVRKTRTELQEEKSRVRQLENLQRQIDRLNAGEVPKTEKAKTTKNAEVARLTKERNALAKSLKVAVPKEQKAIANARKLIQKYQDILDGKTTPDTPKTKVEASEELKALQETLKGLKKAVRSMKNTNRVAKDKKTKGVADPKKIVDKWINRFAEAQSDTPKNRKKVERNKLDALVARYIKEPFASFNLEAQRLGATAEQIRVLNQLITNELAAKQTIAQIRENEAIERKAASRLKKLEDSVKELEALAAKGEQRPVRGKINGPDTQQVTELKDRRAAANKALNALKPVNDDRVIASTQKRTAELERRIREKDFSKTTKVPRAKSNALLEAQARELEAKAAYQRLFVEDNYKKQSVLVKGYDKLVAPLRAVRSVMASVDLPPMFRQGLTYTLRHPFRSVGATGTATRAIFSPAAAKRAAQQIRNHPRYDQLVGWGLSLTESGPNASLKQQEEEFQGDLAQNIFFVRASERGYVTYMNAVRLDMAASMVDSLSPLGGELTKEQGKLITRFVNIMTGRGDLGGAEGAATALAGVFFSPRFWASRIQTVTGAFTATGDLLTGFKFGNRDTVAARKLIAGEYARLMIAYGAFIGGLSMGVDLVDDEDKFDINFDPTSTDFLKTKIGNTRFDTSGGMSSNIVFFVRAAEGKSTDSRGKVTEFERSEDYYRLTGKYVRGKLAPVPGAFLNWQIGEDLVMNKTTLRSEVVGMILPMSPVDVFEQFEEYGPVGGMGTAALTLFGAGGNTYGEDLAPKQKIAIMLGEDKKAFDRKRKKD